MACGALPVELKQCPCCGGGIKQARGFKQIYPRMLFDMLSNPQVTANMDIGKPLVRPCNPKSEHAKPLSNWDCAACVVNSPPEEAGLIWVGRAHYPTPQDFTREAIMQGLSRRIKAIPHWFTIGETWVYFAHLDAVQRECRKCAGTGLRPTDEVGDMGEVIHEKCKDCKGTGVELVPGIFGAFLPEGVDYIVTGKETEEELDRLEQRGVRLVKLERTDGELPGVSK